MLTKAVMGADRLFYLPSFSASTHRPSSALLPWLTPGGTTQENDRNVSVFMPGYSKGESRSPPLITYQAGSQGLAHNTGWLGEYTGWQSQKQFLLKGSILLVLSP